jgi:hypothetical protein
MIIPTGNTVASQPPIGTPLLSSQIPSLPLGYNALNTSIPNPTPVPSRISGVFTPPGYNVASGSIPTPSQFLFQRVPSTFYRRIQTQWLYHHWNVYTVIHFWLPDSHWGEYNPGGHAQFGGQTQIGASSSLGGQPPLGGYNPQYGQNIPRSLAQYWNHLIQGNPQSSGGKQPQVSSFIPPSSGQAYPGSSNPIWGLNVQSSIPLQGNIPTPYNPMSYMPPHTRLNLSGPPPHMQTAYGPTGLPMGLPPQSYQYPHVNRQLPFLATLDLPDLSRILNDPISHSPHWPVIPAKLPSDIPKFDGKSGEDPNNHVMTFHLWCSSNSLMDDSVRLRLFQRTLTGSAAKWYIELPRGFFTDFNTLAMDFLTHYQLPIRYETGTEILSSFKQTKATHISDHIHEWRRRRRLIKLELPDQLLAEWFTKSFVNEISHDISMGGVVTEEQAISHAQYLDLVYSQTGTLYNLLPDAPRPSTTATSTTPAASHAADGVIGTFHAQPQTAQASTTNPKSNASNVQNALISYSSHRQDL